MSWLCFHKPRGRWETPVQLPLTLCGWAVASVQSPTQFQATVLPQPLLGYTGELGRGVSLSSRDHECCQISTTSLVRKIS